MAARLAIAGGHDAKPLEVRGRSCLPDSVNPDPLRFYKPHLPGGQACISIRQGVLSITCRTHSESAVRPHRPDTS